MTRLILAAILATVMLACGVAFAQDDAAPATDATAAIDAPADDQVADDKPMTSGEAFLRKLVQGGMTMFFLLLVSIAGVAYAIERFVNLRKGKIVPEGLAAEADRLWRGGQHDAVLQLARRTPSTLGRMIEAIVTHRQATASDVNMIAGDLASRELRRHLQRAYPLAVVATISPLLGLLGTVIGMIGAFDQVAIMGELANPAAFGGDIAKALITTGAGLSVAIPALALYHYFKSRITIFGVELEEQAGSLITDWFTAATRPAPAAAPAPTPKENAHAN
jgi:biopolymer transport protein ExbB